MEPGSSSATDWSVLRKAKPASAASDFRRDRMALSRVLRAVFCCGCCCRRKRRSEEATEEPGVREPESIRRNPTEEEEEEEEQEAAEQEEEAAAAAEDATTWRGQFINCTLQVVNIQVFNGENCIQNKVNCRF
uniref:Uncharacterized protein n=1 Tax=Sphaerodactylus townsendi TaxID=933632 RepID=A0ACB8F156_9SAUR